MKLFHTHTYQKLGFQEILDHGARRLVSSDAKARWAHIAPLTNASQITLLLSEVNQFKQLIEEGEKLPGFHFVSMSTTLSKVEVEGNWLNIDELAQLLYWLRSIIDIRNFFKKHQELAPDLDALVNASSFHGALMERIDQLIDERGNLRDDASPELLRIRKSQKSASKELREVLYKVLRKALDHNWSQDKEITIRNDRFVIPVKAESKGNIPGFVQDVSQSGNTVFVEPAEALTLNNRIRELQMEEKNEILRILQSVTREIARHADMLEVFQEVMIQLELIRAKAQLAIELGAIYPEIRHEVDQFEIRKAYYPLLLLKAKKEGMKVIPLSMSFESKGRIVVISGPNAGGKSVSLKTVGLLQLMLQSGFLVPVEEGSTFRIFDSLFINIGDEQSVESDLSTYTSHLFHLRQMGDNMNERSLFLIDEFGSGTDPKQGGAIAEAFLERFLRQGAYGVITTHYGNIKKFAELTKGIANAAMEFDTAELKPTYRLLTGVPGRSYAFEIAERVGVHPTIIRKARKKVGKEEVDVEKLLEELEKKNTRLNQLLSENKKESQKLERLVKENDSLQSELVRRRRKVVNQAKQEANKLIQEANRKIENTIREIKEQQAEKEITKKLREELDAAVHEVEVVEEKAPKEVKDDRIVNGKIEEGDWVKLKNAETQGQLIDLQGKKGVMLSGGMKLQVKIDQLQKIKPPKQSKAKDARTSGIRMVDAQVELRVMGMRVDEALIEVDQKVDKALLAGLRMIKILHGKGTGALREAIRNHLKRLPFVTAYYDATEEEGGAGWTIVEFR